VRVWREPTGTGLVAYLAGTQYHLVRPGRLRMRRVRRLLERVERRAARGNMPRCWADVIAAYDRLMPAGSSADLAARVVREQSRPGGLTFAHLCAGLHEALDQWSARAR